MKLFVFAIFSLVLFLQIEVSNAICCKKRAPWGCCGRGKCNIFCCNCDGGQSQVDVKDRFDLIDADANGQIDLDEAYNYLKVERENYVPQWFIEMDQNGDGFVSPNEFNSDLA